LNQNLLISVRKLLLAYGIGLLSSTSAFSSVKSIKTDTISFLFEGKRLRGFLDLPENTRPSGIVILVPGYGKTNFGEANWYYDSLRSNFTRAGFGCFQWDKAGCGNSEGVFDADQPVENSAKEVVAAINELKRRTVPGIDKIGLWGISRAGWICPLVIQQYPFISFWISVSGTDDKENFGYLLESNFRIEGRSEKQTQLLVTEWKKSTEIFRKGGSFEKYQQATQNLRQDSFWISVTGTPAIKAEYEQNQKKFIIEHHPFDEASGLMIYIQNFSAVLRKINCPVLAVFGERDKNVDWRKTRDLYSETIGKNKNSSLTVRILQNCNHSLIKCKTGGLHEKIVTWQYCDDYFPTINSWLKEL
jgi:pimeloyl-ACP methyl ester carboxylesterase